jgi:hypothetical protein
MLCRSRSAKHTKSEKQPSVRHLGGGKINLDDLLRVGNFVNLGEVLTGELVKDCERERSAMRTIRGGGDGGDSQS